MCGVEQKKPCEIQTKNRCDHENSIACTNYFVVSGLFLRSIIAVLLMNFLCGCDGIAFVLFR